MNKFFLHHIRFGDFQVTEEHFYSLINFARSVDSTGHKRYQVVHMVDDREPLITYVYIWCRNSDFFYLGYIDETGE